MIPTTWTEKQLGEICNIAIGKTPSRGSRAFWDTELQTNNTWLSIADLNLAKNKIVDTSTERISDKALPLMTLVSKGTLLLSFKLTIGRLAFAGKDLYTNEAIAQLPIKDGVQIDKYYLYYYLSAFDYETLLKGDVKVKGKSLNKQKLNVLPVYYPSLTEQRRIVEKLDTLFADIEKEKQIAQQNLQNAKELFESELHKLFTENTEEWVEKDFEHCIKPITYTNKIQRKNFLDSGKFPIVSQEDALINGYWNEDVDVFKIDQPVVIFGDHTKKIKYVDFDFVLGADGVKILAPITEIMPKYFYYCLQSIRIRDLGYARHYRLLKEKTIKYSDLQAQKEIVEKLDVLHEQIQELEQIYTQQIADLDELKQAILKKAFNGEL